MFPLGMAHPLIIQSNNYYPATSFPFCTSNSSLTASHRLVVGQLAFYYFGAISFFLDEDLCSWDKQTRLLRSLGLNFEAGS